MKRILIAFFAAAVGLGLTLADAEAKRLGGGRSFGTQRDGVMQRQATPPAAPAAPTQQNIAPAKPAQPSPAPQPSGASRWLGPLAGLAAGIGLAALLSHLGLGEEFATILMLLLLAAAVFFIVRLLFRRAQPQPQYAGGVRAEPMSFEAPPAAGSAAPSATDRAHIPAGFDVEGFLRQAKLHFVRLQAANDAKNLEDIRNFTTPEMFAELRLEMQERGDAAQQTDVVTLNAELRDVAEEGSQYLASVRYFGTIREEAGAAPQPFDEVWHLAKPVDGSRGWVIAGIQQFS